MWRPVHWGDLVSHGEWGVGGYAPSSSRDKCDWKAVGLVGGDGKLVYEGQHNNRSLAKCTVLSLNLVITDVLTNASRWVC